MYWKEPYHKDKHDSGSREHSLHQDIFQLCNYINPHKMTDFKQLCQIKISVTQIEQEEEKKKKKGYRKLNSLLDINFKMTDYIFFTIIHNRKFCLWHFTYNRKKIHWSPAHCTCRELKRISSSSYFRKTYITVAATLLIFLCKKYINSLWKKITCQSPEPTSKT